MDDDFVGICVSNSAVVLSPSLQVFFFTQQVLWSSAVVHCPACAKEKIHDNHHKNKYEYYQPISCQINFERSGSGEDRLE
eukprot:2729318-Amphidinium_carterae.1